MFGEQQRFMLLLIAPAALLLLLFQVVPIAIGANASFRNWALYNPKKTWVGLDHYYAVISDPAFLYVVLPNTFVFMILSVAGALVVGLALALLLNRPFHGQKLVQTVLLVPLMVTSATAGNVTMTKSTERIRKSNRDITVGRIKVSFSLRSTRSNGRGGIALLIEE